MSYHPARWPPSLSTPMRCTIAAVIVIPLLLIGVLGSIQPGTPPDSGLAACTSITSANHVTTSDYLKIRAQFSRSRWADLRTAGTAYADLAMQLLKARNTDGYETVWFYERLSAACAKHRRAPEASTCQNGYARHRMPGGRRQPAHQDKTVRTCETVTPSSAVASLRCRDRARCREQETLTGPFIIDGPVLLRGQ